MKRVTWTAAVLLTGGLAAALLTAGVRGQGQQMLRDGFESRDPRWQQGSSDAPFKETAHRLTDEHASDGRHSEYLELTVGDGPGSFIHYTYDVGRAPVADELNVSLWLRCNRPGVQLLCRVVLPRERDPHNLDQNLTVLVHADEYQNAGRWQPLALKQPVKKLQEQLRLLRAELKRDVVAADAYVDRLVLNVDCGPGLTQVYVDDLQVGPVLEARPPAPPVAPAPGEGASRPAAPKAGGDEVVKVEGKQLLVDGKPFFPRIIRHTGTPLKTLHDAGFNAVALDESSPPGLIEDAVALDFKIVPVLAAPPDDDATGGKAEGQLTARQAFGRKVSLFLDRGSILCWDLGGDLTDEQFKSAARTAQTFRTADPWRPVSADVRDGSLRYSRGVEQLLLGMHRWPLMTGMELTAYRDWLTQRRQLAQPGAFCWTWVQTHVPDWFLALAYDRDAGGAFTEPLGPQPEQIQLMAYTALGCGYRGLGFWSDRFLADSHTGRDRLLAMAQLNQQLQLLEPFLEEGRDPTWIDTNRPEVKAAVIRTKTALLVLPVWIGGGAQFVPGQSAAAGLELTVPMAPPSWGAWEVSPGELRSLQAQRVLNGMHVTLHDFGLASAVVFTGDLGGVVVRLQNQQRQTAPLAAQWACDQAAEEFAKTERIETELEQAGHTLPDGAELMRKAREALDRAAAARRDNAHETAYSEAQTALRTLRVLMRAQWESAVKPLAGTPTASPYAVSFYTLPKHWKFWDEVGDGKGPWAANVLPDGDFETPPERVPQGWLVQEAPSLDDVTATARRVADGPEEGKQCLMLRLTPKDKESPPLALERTFLAIHSPAVRLPAGTPVRISAWVRVPAPITASVDGALVYDSAGGEPLAVRLTEPTKWKKITLYRRVPATGTVNVTLALTGLGTVYFDDVRVELLDAAGETASTSARPFAPSPGGRN
jgi:hypothetical protein